MVGVWSICWTCTKKRKQGAEVPVWVPVDTVDGAEAVGHFFCFRIGETLKEVKGYAWEAFGNGICRLEAIGY